MKFKNKLSLGFTLIELLVVISILGVLAGAILVGVNPLEQLARGRDASKLTIVSGLGRAIQSYYTTQDGTYPTTDNTWMTTIQSTGELKSLPSAPGNAPCPATGANLQNGYCYNVVANEAVVYVLAESTSSFTKAGCSTGEAVWVVWSSAASKTGYACTTNSTTNPTPTSTIF